MSYENEIWKECPLNSEYENTVKIEISNFGRFRTYNSKHPEGKILKGTLQEGYPILRVKFFKKRKKYEQEKIDNFNKEIKILNDDLKALGYSNAIISSKEEIRQRRDTLIKNRSKYIHRTNLKRTVNYALLIHKAVAELFLEKPKERSKKFIIHKDFDKQNNHEDNLAWASQKELTERSKLYPKNILYAFRKQFEERKPNTKMGKLTENDVLYVKKRLKKGDTLKKLAQKFGVSDMQIHRIKTGENWSHVKLIEDILEEKK